MLREAKHCQVQLLISDPILGPNRGLLGIIVRGISSRLRTVAVTLILSIRETKYPREEARLVCWPTAWAKTRKILEEMKGREGQRQQVKREEERLARKKSAVLDQGKDMLLSTMHRSTSSTTSLALRLTKFLTMKTSRR